MTKKAMAAFLESLAAQIAQKVGCDQTSGRAFLVASLKAKATEIVTGAVPTVAQGNLPRIGPDGSVIGLNPEVEQA